MLKKPGMSLTLGMSQGTGEPFARITGRSGPLVLSKRLNLFDNKGLLGAAAAFLLANALKKTSDGKVRKAKEVKGEKLSSTIVNPFNF